MKLLQKIAFLRKTKEKQQKRDALRLFFTGFAMGSADIVPGVSGGTIAFIFGIYEELIYSIKTASGDAVKLLAKGNIKKALETIPFNFLLPLVLGIFTAIFSVAGIMSSLLETHPVPVWSFFFGLVLSSIFIVSKRVIKWDYKDAAALIIATAGAYTLVGAVPHETPQTTLALFLAGAIAICAMILPGISGSFLLIIMGKYSQILSAVNDRNFMVLATVGIGAVIGLATFSRVLNWLFKNYHDLMVATLTGFMIGSLRKIWPWKETLETRINSHGIEVPLLQQNILPSAFTTEVLMSLVLFVAAVSLMIYVQKLELTEEHLHDVEDKKFRRKHRHALQEEL